MIFREKHLYVIVQYTVGLYTIHAQCSRFEIAVVQGARPICRSVRHHIWICILLTPPHGSFMVREISISNIFHFIWSQGWISELLTSEMPTGGQFWGGQLWVSQSSELPTLKSLFFSSIGMTPQLVLGVVHSNLYCICAKFWQRHALRKFWKFLSPFIFWVYISP